MDFEHVGISICDFGSPSLEAIVIQQRWAVNRQLLSHVQRRGLHTTSFLPIVTSSNDILGPLVLFLYVLAAFLDSRVCPRFPDVTQPLQQQPLYTSCKGDYFNDSVPVRFRSTVLQVAPEIHVRVPLQ